MKVLNIKVFCVKVYCLYSTLNGDSRRFIYISKAALYIDKEDVRDRTVIILITVPIHHHFMLLIVTKLLHIIY